MTDQFESLKEIRVTPKEHKKMLAMQEEWKKKNKVKTKAKKKFIDRSF